MCHAMPFSARALKNALKENNFFVVDIVVKNKSKCGFSWYVLLSKTSTCHHSFPKHFFELFLHIKEARKGFLLRQVCEKMEDYKEGCLLVWANYMSLCNSIVGLYFKGTCDVISVTMATHKVHKSGL